MSDKALRKHFDVEEFSEMPQKGVTNSRRSGYNVKDLTFGIWSDRTPSKTGAQIALLSQLKTKNNTGGHLPEGHTSQTRGIRGWGRRAEDKEEWR